MKAKTNAYTNKRIKMTRQAQYEQTQCKILSKIRYLRKKLEFISNSEDLDYIERDFAQNEVNREISKCQWVSHRIDRAIERLAAKQFAAQCARVDYMLAAHSVYLSVYQTHLGPVKETLTRCETIAQSFRQSSG